MDEIKILNFAREHPNSPFPEYEKLTDQKTDQLRRVIKQRTGMPSSTSPLNMVRHLAELAIPVPGVTADDEDFNLKSIMHEAGILPADKVFVNWHRFDEIDKISIHDLSKHFDDIWYPRVDDIDIFDENLRWIISIGYSGAIRLLKLSRS